MANSRPLPATSDRLEIMVAVACGLTVANLYVAQPLLGDIAAELGLPARKAGLVVTLAQLGYGAGLLFIVPLGDLFENRRLSAGVLSLAVLGAAIMAASTSSIAFLIAGFFLGLGLVTVQILLPYVATLASPERQGLVVGRVMAGILTGIMLSRPVAGLLADLVGWRGVFMTSAALCAVVITLIWLRMPPQYPSNSQSYSRTLRLLWNAATTDRLLQRRAAYQFLMFYSYTLFWTVCPLLLADDTYGLEHRQIAAVTLAGAAGAMMSPVAGRIADKGLVTVGTILALLAGTASWGIAAFGISGGAVGLASIVFAALLLDGAVPVSLVLSQRELFAANPDKRATYNGLFMALFFMGGALGASVGVWAFESFGWLGATVAGTAGPAIATAVAITTQAKTLRQPRRTQ